MARRCTKCGSFLKRNGWDWGCDSCGARPLMFDVLAVIRGVVDQDDYFDSRELRDRCEEERICARRQVSSALVNLWHSGYIVRTKARSTCYRIT